MYPERQCMKMRRARWNVYRKLCKVISALSINPLSIEQSGFRGFTVVTVDVFALDGDA